MLKLNTLFYPCVIVTKMPPTGDYFGLEGFWGKPQEPYFPSPHATMLTSRLDCSKVALTTPQIVLYI